MTRLIVAAECLWVAREDRVVATLERDASGGMTLTYAEPLVAAAAGTAILSASLPVREEPYGQVELLPFFDGLLPEGTARDRLATRLRLEPDDVFGFLREIGRDCAGLLDRP
jgi:serine/threonine-protein kinase HipA